jgi:hypothetical protein
LTVDAAATAVPSTVATRFTFVPSTASPAGATVGYSAQGSRQNGDATAPLVFTAPFECASSFDYVVDEPE